MAGIPKKMVEGVFPQTSCRFAMRPLLNGGAIFEIHGGMGDILHG
jgi:hypothetical protein